MSREDFKSLKAGDKVIINSSFYDDRVETIDRITNTQIVIGNSKFKRTNGWQIGDNIWSKTRLSIGTPEKIAEIEHKQRMNAIRSYVTKHLNEFNDAQLEAMYRAIKDNENKNGTEQ